MVAKVERCIQPRVMLTVQNMSGVKLFMTQQPISNAVLIHIGQRRSDVDGTEYDLL